MPYDAALKKAWDAYRKLGAQAPLHVRFLADEYSFDVSQSRVMSLSCNIPAKDFAAILILHYCVCLAAGLPALNGQWVNFREFSGVEGYEPVFRKRVIEPIIKKYGHKPEAVFDNPKRLALQKIVQGDVGVIVEAFDGVPVLVELWRGDDEFGPEANLLFDRSVMQIFCTEDIIVLAEMVARSL